MPAHVKPASALAIATLALAIFATAGCGRPAEAFEHDASLVPITDVGEASAGPDFSGSVPQVRGSSAPADTLRMVREFGSDVSFGLVTRVRTVGDYLIAADRFVSPHFSVFDRRSGRLVTRFGRDGEGPGEFRDPAEIFVVRHEPAEVWIYDFHIRRATRVELDSRGQPSAGQQLSLNVGAPLENPAWIDDRILANGVFPDYTLLEIDLEGTPLRRIAADVPFSRAIQNTVGGRQANRNSMVVRPARDRLVLAYQWTNRLDFFTTAGERYGTITGPRAVRTRFKVDGNRFRWEDDTEVAYFGVDATDEYVFAMFCGCTTAEGEELPDRLHVFRWNGDFVAELALDRPLAAISVSPDGSRLYGAFIEPAPGVGEWEMPAALR